MKEQPQTHIKRRVRPGTYTRNPVGAMLIALHHALHNATDKSDAERIILQFMQGYKRANKLDEQALKSILPFMKYRQLCNFAWCYPDNVSEDEQDNILNGFTFKGCQLTEDIFI